MWFYADPWLLDPNHTFDIFRLLHLETNEIPFRIIIVPRSKHNHHHCLSSSKIRPQPSTILNTFTTIKSHFNKIYSHVDVYNQIQKPRWSWHLFSHHPFIYLYPDSHDIRAVYALPLHRQCREWREKGQRPCLVLAIRVDV